MSSGQGSAGTVIVGLLLLALAGAAWPSLVLLGTPYAHGYDGWYYVLQVRSLLDGSGPLFDDDSLVFVLLKALAWITGDAVLGDKLAAMGFAAVTAVAGGVAGWRWTGGSRWAGAAVGLWWALSPLHLAGSVEFLKNAGGLAVLAVLLAVLPRCEERRASLLAAVALVCLGPFVHKLTGVLGLVLAASYAGARGRLSWRVLAGAAVLAVLALGVVGLLRPVDLARFTSGGGGSRWTVLAGTRLLWPEKLELVGVHIAPFALLAASRRLAGSARAAVLSVAIVGLICLAPGLPFSFDLTAWRLMLMGLLPLGLGLGLLAARGGAWGPVVTVFIAGIGILAAPGLVHAHRGRSPDYAAWEPVLPLIQARVEDGQRLVAHRGLCGFLWAEGGRVCENFQPTGDLTDWWRVAYGFDAARLAEHSQGDEAAPVNLIAGYSLVPEPTWRRFVQGEGARFRLTRDERNPFTPRPGFVYGPGRVAGGAPEP